MKYKVFTHTIKINNIMSKRIFFIIFGLVLSVSLTQAQNDTMYIMKSGNIIGQYKVTEVDSVIFHKPSGTVDTTITNDDSTVIKPKVNLISLPNYQVESAYIGRSSSTSSYIYGLIKVMYVGSSNRNYVKMDADFKDQHGNIIYSDYTYLEQPNVAWGGLYNSNSFVTPTYNTGYFKIIENLANHGAVLTDIESIDISITSSSFTYNPAHGQITLQGTPYRIEIDSWYQDIINDGEITVEYLWNTFMFIDYKEREFKWTFGSTYKWNETSQEYEYNTTFANEDYGYFRSVYNTPDYLGSNYLNLSSLCMEWDPVTKKSISITDKEMILNLKNSLNNESLTTVERDKLLKKNRDKLIELQSEE